MVSKHRLWTFKVIPGNNSVGFLLQVPGNPNISIPPQGTVFHLMLTEEQAMRIKMELEKLECKVQVKCMEGESSEQVAEREALLGFQRENVVWPTLSCTDCFWFDPLNADCPCMLDSSTETIIQAAREANPKAVEDESACPLKQGALEIQ